MGIALQMYVDQQQTLMSYYHIPGIEFWFDDLRGYLGLHWTNKVFHCPSYKGSIVHPYFHGDGNFGISGSYAYNAFGSDSSWGNGTSDLGLGMPYEAEKYQRKPR